MFLFDQHTLYKFDPHFKGWEIFFLIQIFIFTWKTIVHLSNNMTITRCDENLA